MDVLEYIKNNYRGYDISEIRIKADRFVANKYNVNHRTIADAYRRRLKNKDGNDLGTQYFDRLLESWLSKGDQELKNIVLKHCKDSSDTNLVLNFFGIKNDNLIDKPRITGKQEPLKPRKPNNIPDYEELINLVIEVIAPRGGKKFPEEFLNNNEIHSIFEVELPGTFLQIDSLFKSIIASPKKLFKYEARNPAEAKYIYYSHGIGINKISIPQDNLILFKAVKNYEKYCRKIKEEAFGHVIEFTNDEHQADLLTQEIVKRLGLRGI